MALHWHSGHGSMYCCSLPLCDHIHRPCRTLELPKNLENENNWQGSTKSVQKIKWLQLHFNLTPVLGCREKLKPCQINDVYGNLCLNNYVSHVQRQVVGYSMQHGIIFRKHRSSHNLVSSNPHQVTKLKDWTNDTYSTIPAYHWLQMQPWVLPWTNRDLKAQPIKNLKDQTLILTWETIRQTKKLRICLFLNLRTGKLANSPSCIVQTKL